MRYIVRADGRTFLAKEMRRFRAALLKHVLRGKPPDAKPSAPQLAIIDLCTQLRVRLVAFDLKFADSGGEMSMHDSRQYLAWCNTLSRTLRHLGLDNDKADAAANSLNNYLHETLPDGGGT